MKTKILSLLLCVGLVVACNNTQKGAGIGAGIYKDANEAFATLDKLQVIEPDAAHRDEYLAAYARWKAVLESKI